MSKSIFASVLVSVLIIFVAVPVCAAPGAGAINLSFNTSTRAEGLGGAGVALVWDENPAHWANPALIGFRPGIHYLDYRSELAKGLADDIVLTNKELVLSAFGVGLLIAKGPLDGNFLDMGVQQSTNEEGEPTGEFSSYMEAESWGLSLDGVQVAEALLGMTRGTLSRYASLAGGMVWKDFEDRLAPDDILQDVGGGGAQGECKDRGWVLRATPLNLGYADDRWADTILGLTLGGSIGRSVLNKTDEFIKHVDADQSDPFPTSHLSGWTLRLAVPWAEKKRAELNEAGFGILGDALDPFFSFTLSNQEIVPGFVWNEDQARYFYEKDDSGMYDEKNHGWEMGFANILYLRRGNIEALWGDIDGPTSGWGLNLQAGRFGGFRYDAATVPQARGLPAVERRSWSMWVDPVALFVD